MAVERHGSVGKRNEQRPGWGHATPRRPIRQPSACPSNGREQEVRTKRCTGHHDHGYDIRCEMRWRSDAPVAAAAAFAAGSWRGSWRGRWRGRWRGSWALGLVGGGGAERECSMWRLGSKSRRHDSDGAAVRCLVSGWLHVPRTTLFRLPSQHVHASTRPPRYSQPAHARTLHASTLHAPTHSLLRLQHQQEQQEQQQQT
jgi:hypothetical protein